MHLLVFVVLFVVECFGEVKVLIDEKGGYNISVNNKVWLRSSRTAIYADDQWYSTENNSLSLFNRSTEEGNDPYLGYWNETKLVYQINVNEPIVAHIRQWKNISAITFHLQMGDKPLTNTIPLGFEEVRSVFPSFYVEKIDDDDQRGYFTVGGQLNFCLENVRLKRKDLFKEEWEVKVINMQVFGIPRMESFEKH